MHTSPVVSGIRIFPIKSLDGIPLEMAEIGHRSLLHDREFAMLGADGRLINGKRTGRVNQLKAEYNLNDMTVNFSERNETITHQFKLLDEQTLIESYLTDFFKLPVHLLHNQAGRLLDIPDTSCLSVVSQETMQYLAQEMPGHDAADLRLRFRVNIELTCDNPFWEERLASSTGMPVPFSIGSVHLTGNSLRARCNVPPRHPHTGETDKTFVKQMTRARARNIPEWSMVDELPSLYYLSIDCSIPTTEKGKQIRIGDQLALH